MGCDITAIVEARTPNGWRVVDDNWMDQRSYGVFGFLADVRNYSHVPPISEPRGLPDDSEANNDWYGGLDGYSASWLSLKELLEYDYDQVFWDRRVTKGTSGAALAEEGEGRHLPIREFLGGFFFKEVERLKEYGEPEDVRVVFWFGG